MKTLFIALALSIVVSGCSLDKATRDGLIEDARDSIAEYRETVSKATQDANKAIDKAEQKLDAIEASEAATAE